MSLSTDFTSSSTPTTMNVQKYLPNRKAYSFDSGLHKHPIFRAKVELMHRDERVALAYKRARLLIQTYKLTVDDVVNCTPKFWAWNNDPACAIDAGLYTILQGHINLAIGTIGRYIKQRPDLKPLLDDLLRADKLGYFLLSERGHGLDAFNLEATATKTDWGFVLDTPREEAYKYMPATTPLFGYRKVAIVMARLMVDGTDRGVRPFIVPLCDEYQMCEGVENIRLPPRTGTSPLDFSITRFNKVRLPPNALVSLTLEKPERPLEAWWNEIWRIPFGTVLLAGPQVQSTKLSAYIGGKYSQWRIIVGKGDKPDNLLQFRQQQWAVLEAVAVGLVLDAWYPVAVQAILDKGIDSRARHGLAAIVKTTCFRHFQRASREICERCGGQGTLEYGLMARADGDAKGLAIADGDLWALSIRLFSELLNGRYQIPLPDSNSSLLAKHATAIFQENAATLKSLGGHRTDEYNALILPDSQKGIEAMGHALAYQCAVACGLSKPIIDMYEVAVIRQDPAWYSEKMSISTREQRVREDRAVRAALPGLDGYLEALGVEPYASISPLVSEKAWKEYLDELPKRVGNAQMDLYPVKAAL